jgi:hypothetical protein
VALRSASACTDTLLLAALNGLILYVVAAFTGVSIAALIEANGEAVATFCGVTSVLYYVVLAGIGGQTLGARLFPGPQAAPAGPLRPAAILRRAGRAWFEQASILVDVVLYADPTPVKSLLSRLDVTRRRAA